jgi:arylsulfatase A-like enzyme
MSKMSRRKVLVAAGAAGVAAAGGVLGFNILRRRRRNFVFIIMDAVRADRIGMKGPGGKSLTPFLDAAARTGTVFGDCIAASSWTLPSVAGLFTARIPIVTGESYGEAFANGARSFTEVLRDAGYYTCAVVKNPWLPIRTATGAAVPTVVTRGFDRYEPGAVIMGDNPLYPEGIGEKREFIAFPPAEKAADEAINILKARGADRRPFFLYAHFMNTHEPYSPSPGDMAIANAAPNSQTIPDYLLYKAIRKRAKDRGKDILTEEDRPLMARAEALYNAAVASTDAAIARIAEYLKSAGVYEDTVFVVTADHGEEFGEHGWFGHALTLYQEVLRVPLIVWGPGIPAGRTRKETVVGIETGPTILLLAGLKQPEGGDAAAIQVDKDWMAPPEAVSSTVFPALPRKLDTVSVSVIAPSKLKVIVKRPAGRMEEKGAIEIYDLAEDPAERANIAGDDETMAEVMLGAVAKHVRTAAARGTAPGMAVDDETMKQFKAIGYVN